MIRSKMLQALILTCGLLIGASAHAESEAAAMPITTVNSLDIPASMKTEHEKLHSALVPLTQAGGQTGDAAKLVAEVLEHHFTKENEYALPPLSLLVPLSQGKFECNMTEVIKMTDRLKAEMPTMLSEHKDLVAALQKLKDAATAENNLAGVQFAEDLTAHAQTEEEITYPTALLVGLYVKSRAIQCQ
jgi:hemerythrin HHE cation binding domain-containing protein